ncbi:MAG: hypothetical protein KIS89_03845 [Dokdonella sp.]|nr:hypothetical protein [Dokdonella sp.]MDL1870391.1 hypothetical protein [Gammaproteobacteria bacterium PRO6]
MNAKMKVLSLALVGMFGYVGGAIAACPTGPTTAEGGAWTAKFVSGGSSSMSIATPGLDGSECKLRVSLGNNGLAQAQVMDDTPANEPHYRAQFLFDAGALTGANGASQAVIFAANAPAVYGGLLQLVKVNFSGSGGGSTTAGKRIIIRTACAGGAGSLCGSAPITLPNQTGVNRIEFDLVVGATGALRFWVTDGAASGGTDASPTGTITVTGGNAGWTGVDKAYMGLSTPTAAFRSGNADTNAFFDRFDSRRQTFIGG